MTLHVMPVDEHTKDWMCDTSSLLWQCSQLQAITFHLMGDPWGGIGLELGLHKNDDIYDTGSLGRASVCPTQRSMP